jgi:hypothetical protein
VSYEKDITPLNFSIATLYYLQNIR